MAPSYNCGQSSRFDPGPMCIENHIIRREQSIPISYAAEGPFAVTCHGDPIGMLPRADVTSPSRGAPPRVTPRHGGSRAVDEYGPHRGAASARTVPDRRTASKQPRRPGPRPQGRIRPS